MEVISILPPTRKISPALVLILACSVAAADDLQAFPENPVGPANIQHGQADLGPPPVLGPNAGNSAFFSTVQVDERTTVPVLGNGDLWPSCWGADGALYSASGDGWGMDEGTRDWSDIRISVIGGMPPAPLSGKPLARGDAIASVWSGRGYNRKPTGMVCVGDDIYVAVQDLALDFQQAPALSISRSRDRGVTWTWDRAAPMFRDAVFTTLMFLDYGRNNSNAKDGFVYAYATDGNWRFSTMVPDPERLYLGRVRPDRIQDRAAWEFFIGVDSAGKPLWSADIQDRKPVLEDRSRAFQHMVVSHPAWPGPMTRIAQGGVFYNPPLDRYIYTSWTRFSWEFYEAAQPWGPWRHFFSKNFGVYPWSDAKHGGYAPSASTKYLSADGKTFYVQANTFLSSIERYGFALRKVHVEPWVPGSPMNVPGSTSLASAALGAVVISYSNHFGTPEILNDGLTAGQSEDSWNGEAKRQDYWGYTWPRPYNLNRLEYTPGVITPEGGWFDGAPQVQVRQNGQWLNVEACSAPPYPGAAGAGGRTYIFVFGDVWGDGIRLIGKPGGQGQYTSIAELTPLFSENARPPCERQ